MFITWSVSDGPRSTIVLGTIVTSAFEISQFAFSNACADVLQVGGLSVDFRFFFAKDNVFRACFQRQLENLVLV